MDTQTSINSILLQKITEQQEKIEKIYRSVESTRKYFLFTLILSIVMFVLPLIGLIFIVPYFLKSLQIPLTPNSLKELGL